MIPGAKKRRKPILQHNEIIQFSGFHLEAGASLGPMTHPGAVLALDFGTRRIGLAVSDPDRTLAFPAGHLERDTPERDFLALENLIREREIARIVVGLPLHMNGRPGEMAEAARTFARTLAERSRLEVELLDERLTSAEAKRSLRGRTGAKRRTSKGDVDAVAATLLLSTYLERSGGART